MGEGDQVDEPAPSAADEGEAPDAVATAEVAAEAEGPEGGGKNRLSGATHGSSNASSRFPAAQPRRLSVPTTTALSTSSVRLSYGAKGQDPSQLFGQFDKDNSGDKICSRRTKKARASVGKALLGCIRSTFPS